MSKIEIRNFYKIFGQNLFSVGCTRRIERLKYLINLIKNPEIDRDYEILNEEVKFSENAISEIAKIATQVNDEVENIGARRLHTFLESCYKWVAAFQ